MKLKERTNGDVGANRQYVSAMLGLQVWAHKLHECAESAPTRLITTPVRMPRSVLSASLSLPLFADTWGMHDGDVGAGWMVVMMLGMVLFWGLVVIGVVWLLREAIGRGHPGHGADPLAILDRRLAEGEISVEEYAQRKKTLSG